MNEVAEKKNANNNTRKSNLKNYHSNSKLIVISWRIRGLLNNEMKIIKTFWQRSFKANYWTSEWTVDWIAELDWASLETVLAPTKSSFLRYRRRQ